MTANTALVGAALEWFEAHVSNPDDNAAQDRKARNEWMRLQGIGGIVKDGKKSKAIPDWWGRDSEFWFADPVQEQSFLAAWSAPNTPKL